MSFGLAIVGATGNVGRKIIEVLEKRNFPVKELYLIASENSVGNKIIFKNKQLEIISFNKFDFSKAKITFFCCGAKLSAELIPKVTNKTIVIDNSSYFRMDSSIPLIVPEVNLNELKKFKNKNIISNPNCSTIQLVLVLKPLHDLFKIKRVVVSTYQSVSGAGKLSMDELTSQTSGFLNKEEIQSKNFTHQIAFNVIPHIDSFSTEGYTKEEIKMQNETKKILDEKINLTATCVRVPVLVSHSESVNIEFNTDFELEEINKILKKAPGCVLYDKRQDKGYATPIDAEGKYETFISRVRKDNSNKNSLNLWIVSDNLLKGAALNAVQIAEKLIKII